MESESLATFSVVVKFLTGKPITITGLSYKEAVKRVAHEKSLWEDDPDVMVYIEAEF